jgi:hypothetical protein
MLINVFLIFFSICFIHLVLFRKKIYLNFYRIFCLFNIPIIVLLIYENTAYINKFYYFFSYSILFVTYYFTLLGISNDSPSLIIIREILKKNIKINSLKKKFLSEKLIEKRFKELEIDNYIYFEKKYLKIKKNKNFIIDIFIQLRKLQDQLNKKNG